MGTHSLVSFQVALRCAQDTVHMEVVPICSQSQHFCRASWELLGLVYLPRLPKVSTANPICSFSVKVFTPAISSCCQNGHRSLTLTFIISNYSFCKMAVSVCVRVLRSFLTFIATILVIVKAPRPGRNFSRIISGSQWRRATDPGWDTKGNIVKAAASTIVLNMRCHDRLKPI